MRKTVKIVAPNGKKAERPLKIDPTRESLMQAITDALKDRTDAITRPEKTTNTMILDIGSDTFKIVVSKIRKKYVVEIPLFLLTLCATCSIIKTVKGGKQK